MTMNRIVNDEHVTIELEYHPGDTMFFSIGGVPLLPPNSPHFEIISAQNSIGDDVDLSDSIIDCIISDAYSNL